jgi:hypothetical protein
MCSTMMESKIMVITGWMEWIRRRRAARRYARLLGPRLRKDYGGGEHYTIGQIRTAARKLNLPERYLNIGYAAFMSEQSFRDAATEDARCDHAALRTLFWRHLPARWASHATHAPANLYVEEALRHVQGHGSDFGHGSDGSY